MFQSLGVNNPRFNRFRRYFATTFTIIVVGRLPHRPVRRPARHHLLKGAARRDTRRQGPRRTDRRQVGQAPLRHPARQPGQQAQVQDHRRRHRPRRRLRGGHLRRARLQRRGLHLPRLATPGPLDRRPGRHQRRQELPQRRRLDLPAVLRHGQGRRLPLSRSQRVPARPGLQRDHRPVHGPGRAVRPGIRRPARQPLFGGAQVSRTFYARGQTGQQLLLGAYQALARQIAVGNVKLHNRTEMLDVVVKDGRAVGIVVRDLDDRRGDVALGPCRRAGDRRLQQRVLPVDQRHGLQRRRQRGVRTARAPTSPTRASRRSTRPASRQATSSSRS